MADTLPEAWLLFTGNARLLASLIALHASAARAQAQFDSNAGEGGLWPLLGRTGAGGLPAL